MSYQSDLLRLLDERGHIHQVTDPVALDTLASKEIVTGYVGFDPTASSLHIGNLASIMLLKRVQQAGHRPIVIMGGGTVKVGDPSAWQIIQPTTNWQIMKTGLKKDTFAVATDLFYVDVRKQ